MPNTNAVAGSVGSCYTVLRRVRQHLYDLRFYDLADDIKDATYVLYRIKQQHDAAVAALEESNATLRADVEKAKRNEAEERQRVSRRDERIREHARQIDQLQREVQKHKDDGKTAFQRGVTVGEGTSEDRMQRRDHTIAVQNQKLTALELKVKSLEQDVSKAKAAENSAWQRGFAAGEEAQKSSQHHHDHHHHQHHNPSPPTQPEINTATRESWLRQLQLTSSYGHTLSSSLKGALILGDREILATVLEMERPRVVAPALHMAALFGDVESAKLLRRHGADVNGSCTATSERGGHVYGVTPMHLAVGAQQEDMIRYLHREGGKFFTTASPVPIGKTGCAPPPAWLVSRRWVTLTGKTTSRSMLRVLRTMVSLGWDTDSVLTREGETMRKLVWKNLGQWRVLQRDVLDFLDGIIL